VTQLVFNNRITITERAKFGVAPRRAGAEIQNSPSKKSVPWTHRICRASFIDVGPAILEP